jgi:hypothetical protein
MIGCTDTEPTPSSGSNDIASDEVEQFGADLESSLAEVSDRVDQLFRSIAAGEAEQIYESMCSTRFREVASLAKFQPVCERIQSRLGGLKSKSSTQFDMPYQAGNPVASGAYQATFEKGSGTILVTFEKIDGEWLLLRLNVNAPELLDDPTQYREAVELLVENSEPLLPGTMVDVIDDATDPPTVMVENVQLLNVRWKVSSPLEQPSSPASGFVTVPLTKEEQRKVQGITLSIRSTKQETAE